MGGETIMTKHDHIQNHDLQSLLDGDSGEAMARQIENHVEKCSTCREQLERLAAAPDVWHKATTLLADETIGETTPLDSGLDLGEFEMSEDASGLAGLSVTEFLQPPSHPELLGRLEHYEIEREIGRGGMGVVLQAHDTQLNRPVAIKVMAPHLAANGAARKRFAREARAAAAVLHPNVIAIHAVSDSSSPAAPPLPFLVMPYVAGPSLEQVVLQQGPLPETEIVRIALQIAAGLAAAHCQGLIHRDIKPANVLIEQGVSRVVITDFGLARAEDDASMTQTGWFAGTPNYMSPEQSIGDELDARSDLFSLGSVLYFLATGRLPFRAEQPMAVLQRIRHDQPTPVRQVNPEISQTLSSIIERLLEKSPDHRFQSAAQLHEVLERYLAHLQHPDSIKRPVIKSLRRHRRMWQLAAVASVGAAVALATLAWWPPGGSTPDPSRRSPIDSLADKYRLRPDSQINAQFSQILSSLADFERAEPSYPDAVAPDSMQVEIAQLDSQLEALRLVLGRFGTAAESSKNQSQPVETEN